MKLNPDKSEGDVNISAFRSDWQNKNVNKESEKILEEDNKYFLHQALSTPCLTTLSACEGSYIIDGAGKKYLDFHGNNVHQVGYKNQDVLNAVIEQLNTLPFSPRRFTNSVAVELAKKLTYLTDNKLSRVLFAPGGAEVVGIALKIARLKTGNYKTISWWGSFHGATLDTISIGGEDIFRKEMGPLLPGSIHVNPPEENNWKSAADEIEEIMKGEGDIAAFIAEPIRYTIAKMPPKEYWLRVRELCDEHGVLLVFDEIPTCLGRSGKMFVHQYYGVIPDMLCLGKGLGGGLFPMAAILAKEELNVGAEKALGHYTHEKTPVGSAAALAVINHIEKNNYLERVTKTGKELKEWLTELKGNFNCIKDVRGIGYLLGVELRSDDIAEKMMYESLSMGLSFKVSGGNTLTLMPPLTISDDELDEFKAVLVQAFSKVD